MQIKNNSFHISFVPAFQLLGLREKCADLFDHFCSSGSLAEYETDGEQFLKCANVNPQVKAVAGFLSRAGRAGERLRIIYSPRFLSRDLRACVEIFSRSANIEFLPLDFDDRAAGGGCFSGPSFCDKIIKEDERDFFDAHFKCLAGSIEKSGCVRQATNAEFASNVALIGSSYPLFNNIITCLDNSRVKLSYFEFFDLASLSMNESRFEQSCFFGLSARADRISRILARGRAGKGKKGGPVKVIHVFPKFSHYEIEDYFFSKNIKCPFLSLEYAGGGTLGERERIRLDAFLKM